MSLTHAISSTICLLLLLAPQTRAVSQRSPTATALSVAPNASLSQGRALTLQATVSSTGTPVAQGTVTFYDGPRVLAAIQVVYSGTSHTPGTATLKFYFGPGSHSVEAAYSGTNIYSPSISTSTNITVAMQPPTATSTAITSSGVAGNYTLRGQVTTFIPTPPTGTVSFLDQTNNNLLLTSASLDPSTSAIGWPAFTAAATANPAYAVLIGDLNGDGIPDLVTSNYSGTTISVLLGNGDGTFQPHADYAVGSFPFGMAMGDLNGDGIPDLAVAAHNASTVQILLGNGDGTFQSAQTLTTAGTSQYVAMSDFNGDGVLDLVTCSSGGRSISIFLGNGDGTFQTQQSFGTGSITYGLTVADFNNDGLPDVAVSNNDGSTVSVFLGNGDGTFQPATDYTVDDSPTTIASADLNADGNVDLVVGNLGGSAISVLLGNGDGTFQTKADYSGFATPWGVSIVDINGDHIPDIAVAGPNAHAIEVFQGNGDGTFLPPVTTPTGITNYIAALGDLNGDGVVDLVVPSITANYVLVAPGSQNETATATAVSIPGGGSHSVVASYAGDTNFSASTSSFINLTGSPFPTALTVNTAPTSASPGQTVVLSANLSPAMNSGFSATGTVTFLDGSTTLGTPANLINGKATLSKSDFSIGIHNITAVYSGDSNFLASNSSTSTVTTTAPQTITLPAFNPTTYGVAPLQLTATASSALPVTFSVISGPAIVSGTTLAITGAGNAVVEADQSGNSNYQPAPPVQRTIVVTKASTSLALTTSGASAEANASVTFTATVASPNLLPPTGSAIFLDSSTQLATVAFNNAGIATDTTTSLPAGSHSITATYSGNANYLPSTSTAVIETIIAPDYSVATNPATLTIQRGNTGTSTLTITPTGGFTGQVAFSCTGLPQYTACSFTPSTVVLPGDNAAHTVQFSLSTIPPIGAASITFTFWSAFGTLAFFHLIRRRNAKPPPFRAAQLAILSAGLLALTSCGGSNSRQVPLGTSTVTMMAATVGGSTQHAATITITITQ